jgi:hypothetical protein
LAKGEERLAGHLHPDPYIGNCVHAQLPPLAFCNFVLSKLACSAVPTWEQHVCTEPPLPQGHSHSHGLRSRRRTLISSTLEVKALKQLSRPNGLSSLTKAFTIHGIVTMVTPACYRVTMSSRNSPLASISSTISYPPTNSPCMYT